MINTQYINLDMTPSGVLPVLYCSQYDVGRPLGIVVYNRAESVDLNNYTCTIEATRTDGTAITAAVTTSGNIGAFVTTATMTNKADKYPAKLVVMDGNGNRVASLAFVLCVTSATMDENAQSIEEDASLYQQYTGTVQTLIADIRTKLNAETAARISAVNAEASARQAADNTLQSNINAEATARQTAINAEATARTSAVNAEASTRAAQDAILQSEINELIAPSGEAPSAAEVQNARIGADGVTYTSLGDAIRGQVGDINTLLTNSTMVSRGVIPANTDINNLKTSGMYTASDVETTNTYVNWAEPGRTGVLLVFNAFSPALNRSYGIVQIARINLGARATYIRAYSGSEWKPWSRISYVDDVQAYVAENIIPWLRAMVQSVQMLPFDWAAKIPVTVNGGISESNGYNVNNNAKYMRTGLISLNTSMIAEMESEDYVMCAWCYSSNATSSGTESPTDKAYAGGMAFIPASDTNQYWRVAFARTDGEDLTTGTGEGTDEYKIKQAFKVYRFTDTDLESTAPIDGRTAKGIKDGIYDSVSVTYTDGYIGSNGAVMSPTSNLEKMTPKIKNVKSAHVVVTQETDGTLFSSFVAFATYDANDAFIERIEFSLSSTWRHDVWQKFDDNVASVIMMYRSLNASLSVFEVAERGSSEAKATIAETNTLALNVNRLKPVYDHLFVNRTTDAVIPHESVYHVRLSKKLGFDMIEANTCKTSDGVWVVNHFSDYKFGNYFHHADGTTDISDIAVESVTWAWIQENVRYNSSIAKYRTAPSRLEDFLHECLAQNLIPFIMVNDPEVLEITDKIMGVNNYVAYKADRSECPNGIICHWKGLTTKQDILDYCESVGKPFIYAMSNPTDFSDADLLDIIHTLHANGYLIATSYQDGRWSKYRQMGFDIIGAQGRINRIDCGNLHNIDSMFGFGNYTYTGAVETNGELVFSELQDGAYGDIYPDIDSTVYSVCGIDVEIAFTGNIVIKAIGEFKTDRGYESLDNARLVFESIPIINGSPKVWIRASKGTVIHDLTFRASKFS